MLDEIFISCQRREFRKEKLKFLLEKLFQRKSWKIVLKEIKRSEQRGIKKGEKGGERAEMKDEGEKEIGERGKWKTSKKSLMELKAFLLVFFFFLKKSS